MAMLAILCLLFAVGEVACRTVIPRSTQTEARRQQERAEAIALRPGKEGRASVLVLGNSLLAEGVDFDGLRRRLASNAALTRFQVESTTYFDWYYGIRLLAKRGARPDIVALMLSPEQLASPAHRGDYSALLLMDRADALTAGAEMGLSNTQSADLALSQASALLGMRTNIRKRVLKALVPGLENVMPLLTFRAEPAIEAGRVEALAQERLKTLRSIVEAHGSRFVLIVPPTNDTNAAALANAVVKGGRASGVPVVVPVVPGSLARAAFAEDGFHLNRMGSEILTLRLGDEIRRLVGVN